MLHINPIEYPSLIKKTFTILGISEDKKKIQIDVDIENVRLYYNKLITFFINNNEYSGIYNVELNNNVYKHYIITENPVETNIGETINIFETFPINNDFQLVTIQDIIEKLNSTESEVTEFGELNIGKPGLQTGLQTLKTNHLLFDFKKDINLQLNNDLIKISDLLISKKYISRYRVLLFNIENKCSYNTEFIFSPNADYVYAKLNIQVNNQLENKIKFFNFKLTKNTYNNDKIFVSLELSLDTETNIDTPIEFIGFIGCKSYNDLIIPLNSEISNSTVIRLNNKELIKCDNSLISIDTFGEQLISSNSGNIIADNVFFSNDLVLTADVGVHTIGSSGSKTLATTGKNLKQVMDMLFSEEKNPIITQPSVNINLNGAGIKEVGTMFTPNYTASLNKGNYQFGPDTGVTVISWNITDTNNGNKNTETGSFNEFQVTDSTNYKITAEVQHSDGVIPLTNLGNNYESGKIIAGTKSKVSLIVTGFRNSFYGTLTDKNELTSDIIRTLTKSNKSLTNGSKFDIIIPVGALRVVIAYPATLRQLSSVLDVNGVNAEIVTGFKESIINVEGLNGYQSIEYKVYILDYANPNNKSNTYKVTI